VGVVDEFPGKTFRGDLLDFAFRMKQQQPQQLASGVTGTPDNGNPDHGVFSRT
jgi:hypothetical protein